VLGVTPDASSDEIVRAFAREMSKPRAFGGLADVSIAYEVLRNPDRRRAYDASIAPEPTPEPDAQAEPVRRPHALHARPHFIAAALPEAAVTRIPEPVVEERKLEVAPVEQANKPSLPPFLANALREIADPAPLPKAGTPPTAPRRREIKPEDAAAPIPRVMIEPMFSEEGAASWKRIAIPAGGAILAVAIIGAWAGSRGKTEPSIDAKAETALIAPPATFDVSDPAADTLAKVEDDVPPPPVATATPVHRTERITHTVKANPPSQLADLDQQLAEPAPAPDAEQAAATDAPKAIAASLPLPNSVIARTIGRIGYPCGSVASTTAGGAPGVFTITCTSGHSYKAAPVHGRYRFSKVRG
jgi:hypothetical protein